MQTETLNPIAPYEPIRAQIAELKAANANTVFKYEEPKGNKLARSHVASLRTVKGDIERKQAREHDYRSREQKVWALTFKVIKPDTRHA